MVHIGFTDELLQAFVAQGVRRVLIAYDADEAGNTAAAKLAPLLEQHGIAPYRVVFPKGMDANSYAQKVGPPAKSLALVIEQAQCLGSGVAPMRDAVAVSIAIEPPASPAFADPPYAAACVPAVDVAALSALLTPAVPASPALEVREDEVIALFGERRYRVRGLKKNLSFDVLKVNVQASSAEHLFIDTLDLYQAKARAAFVKQAAIELGLTEAVIGRDLIALLRALEPVQEAAITRTLKPTPELPALSADDEAAALALLRDPRLMDRIAADLDAIGVVGEESNALVSYLACVSRKLEYELAFEGEVDASSESVRLRHDQGLLQIPMGSVLVTVRGRYTGGWISWSGWNATSSRGWSQCRSSWYNGLHFGRHGSVTW